MALELRGVSVRHTVSAASRLALHDISMSVAPGEQVALIGPSGAGKTTLLHTMACALRPEAGAVHGFGVDPWLLGSRQRHAWRSRLFLAPQTPPLPPRQRVVTSVLAGRLPHWTLWQAIASLVWPRDAGIAYEALARFNLQDKLYARVDRLSGGERQRCSLARLLVSHAKVFLVDEPLSALDPVLAVQTLKVLQQEAAERGAALVCSLHQVELARAYFPRIIGLRGGRVVFDALGEDVSDAMISALYQQTEQPDGENETPPGTGAVLHTPRCF